MAKNILLLSGHALAGAATGGATEPTQWANNILLGKSLTEQATTAAETIKTAINTMEIYKKAVEDLIGLPSSVVQSMLAPFKSDLAAYYKLSRAVDGAIMANERMYEMSVRRMTDMQEMAEKGFDPKYFMSRELELAARNKEAKRRLEEDLDLVVQNEQRLAHLRDVSASAPDSIKSTVSGMHALHAMASLGVAEASETNRLLTAAKAEKSMQEDIAARTRVEAEARERERMAKSKAANDAQYEADIARARAGTLPSLIIGNTYDRQ